MAWNRPESLEGLCYRFRCEEDRLEGMEAAFDYRGDVTLHLTKGREVSGFLFDRSGRGVSGTVELLVPNVQQPRVIEQSEIEGGDLQRQGSRGGSFVGGVERSPGRGRRTR